MKETDPLEDQGVDGSMTM